MNTGREDLIRTFLDQNGWKGCTLSPLAGDASNRRYLRVSHDKQTYVLMDAPPERGEDVVPFVAMTQWLSSVGLRVPEILGSDLEQGLLLLDDLGDRLFARHLAQVPQAENELYAASIDILVELAGHPAPSMIGAGESRMPLAAYDTSVLDREACLVLDWYAQALCGPSQSRTDDFHALIAEATGKVAQSREIVVLRDYHAENLIWLPENTAHRRVGLLDYQDALIGHPAYDLVSLLEDARRDTGVDLCNAMIDRYLSQRPGVDRDQFGADYSVLGAQRNLKIIGIFSRLASRDNKTRYLNLIPRVWGHLQNDLRHPSLKELQRWVGRYIPAPAPAVINTLKGSL